MNVLSLERTFLCVICKGVFSFLRPPLSCPHCQSERALAPLKDGDEIPVPFAGPKSKSVSLGAVKVEPFQPYPTGIRAFDKVVGGLSDDFAIFIAGDKGVGKSTLITDLSMQHCDLEDKRKVFLCSAEEPLKRFLDRAIRLGYGCQGCFEGKWCGSQKHKRYVSILKKRFMGSTVTNIVELHDEIRNNVKRLKFKPSLIIYDSIRKFTHPEVKTFSPLTHGPAVVDEILKLIVELKCCAVAVIRLTKDGKMAGHEDMGYDFDAIVTLERWEGGGKRKKVSKTRRYVTLTCQKNRMGPEGIVGWFRMKKTGMLSCKSPLLQKGKKTHGQPRTKARPQASSVARGRKPRRRGGR